MPTIKPDRTTSTVGFKILNGVYHFFIGIFSQNIASFTRAEIINNKTFKPAEQENLMKLRICRIIARSDGMYCIIFQQGYRAPLLWWPCRRWKEPLTLVVTILFTSAFFSSRTNYFPKRWSVSVL